MDDLFNEYDDDEDGLVAPEEIENHLSAAMVTINNYVMTYDSDNDGKLNSEGKKRNKLYSQFQISCGRSFAHKRPGNEIE